RCLSDWSSDVYSSDLLASTATCENQAFRYGNRAYGLQFHLEADEALIRRWLDVPAYRAEIEAEGGAARIAAILRDTHGHMAAARSEERRVGKGGRARG